MRFLSKPSIKLFNHKKFNIFSYGKVIEFHCLVSSKIVTDKHTWLYYKPSQKVNALMSENFKS